MKDSEILSQYSLYILLKVLTSKYDSNLQSKLPQDANLKSFSIIFPPGC